MGSKFLMAQLIDIAVTLLSTLMPISAPTTAMVFKSGMVGSVT